MLDMVVMVSMATSRLLLLRPWSLSLEAHRFSHHPLLFVVVAVMALVVRLLELSCDSPDGTHSRKIMAWRSALAHCFLVAGFTLVWYDTHADLVGRLMNPHSVLPYGIRTLASSVWIFFATNGLDGKERAITTSTAGTEQ